VLQKACETGKPSLHNSELDQIGASIKSLVQRAYELGRSDTLRKVVEELNALDPSAGFTADLPPAETETVAVTETAPVLEAEPLPEAAPAPEPVFKPLSRPAKPWWARLGR
jgi:hypothetical protein